MQALPEPGKAQDILIPGPVGAIEALVAAPRQAARGFAVVCHPHPLMGGAMTNKVTYTLASAALRFGLYAARFNFRGVGRSAGTHDHGRGETQDTLAMVDWMRAHLGDAPLLLAGFSFGGLVSIRAAAIAKPKLQICVAPPFGKYLAGEPLPPRPDCPWLVVHSRDDDVVAFAESYEVLQRYEPVPTIVPVDGAGHFFHGRLGELQQIVLDFVEAHWPSPNPRQDR